MVSFAHVRTQAHNIFVYSRAGTARHEYLRKQKKTGHQDHGIAP